MPTYLNETGVPLSAIRGCLAYSPDTGHITWLRSSGRAAAGSSAGCEANGYLQIRIKTKLVYAHQVAFYLMTGAWPLGHVDHINGNGLDNRWANLRLVDRQTNARNCAKSKANTSGVTGVTWDRRKQKWMSKITVNGKTLFLGYYTCIESAAAARREAEVCHGFHKNHGRTA